MKPLLFVILFLVGLSFSVSESVPKISLERIYTNLSIERPVLMAIPKDGSNRRFLVEQTGKVKILPNNESGTSSKVFADFSSHMEVEKAFEEGLLGFAFHPKFRENGKFYAYYSQQRPKRTILSEFLVSKDDPDKADFKSERILMVFQQPAWNHNSGNLLFHPENGFLYVTVGDGGSRNGVFMLSPNLNRWQGKVLRIDVDRRTGILPYGIPSDNPFVDKKFASPEIWAYGLRNPWGSDIDPQTGLFYLADVGQDAWEEVNIITKGGNYGWEFREGSSDFAPRERIMAALGQTNRIPKNQRLIDPIHQYDHSATGGISITGGYVYRGKEIPNMEGYFIYGDWKFGNMWALQYDPKTEHTTNHVIFTPPSIAQPTVQPTGFYPDENGEPIVLGWRGKMFRMVAK